MLCCQVFFSHLSYVEQYSCGHCFHLRGDQIESIRQAYIPRVSPIVFFFTKMGNVDTKLNFRKAIVQLGTKNQVNFDSAFSANLLLAKFCSRIPFILSQIRVHIGHLSPGSRICDCSSSHRNWTNKWILEELRTYASNMYASEKLESIHIVDWKCISLCEIFLEFWSELTESSLYLCSKSMQAMIHSGSNSGPSIIPTFKTCTPWCQPMRYEHYAKIIQPIWRHFVTKQQNVWCEPSITVVEHKLNN